MVIYDLKYLKISSCHFFIRLLQEKKICKEIFKEFHKNISVSIRERCVGASEDVIFSQMRGSKLKTFFQVCETEAICGQQYILTSHMMGKGSVKRKPL